MQDRFKFRVWEKDQKIMKECTQITLDKDQKGSMCDVKGKVTAHLIYQPHYILMQCTGLKDKNGNLIYEGDILGGIYENLDIFYCPQCMQFELHAKGYGCMCCNGDIHWCEVVEDNNKLEVIGNIYENEETLNE
jgi:hypothetical protein